MKRIVAVILVFGFIVSASAPASALVPSVTFWSDDNSRAALDIPLYQDLNGLWHIDSFEHSTSEYSVRLHDVVLDPDPSIAYGIAAVDFGAPSTFSFSFSTPIIPVGSPNVVSASIVGGLTDFSGDGVSFTPTAAFAQISEVGAPLTNMGVDVGNAFSIASGPAGSLYAYGSYASGPMAGPGPGPWTVLQTTTSFTLSGGSDIVALTGFSQIVPATEPVPEPASILLLGAGLLGAAFAWRRKRA